MICYYYLSILVACHFVGGAWATCQAGNCTADDDDVSVEKVPVDGGSSTGNLAWLVTPALFGLGVMFLIYKCCKDGLCNCRRLRQRAVLEYHREHGYIPLSQVVVHTTAGSGQAPDPNNLPPLPPGLRRHLIVIHNQTFCITLRDPPALGNNGGDGGSGGEGGNHPCCCHVGNEQCLQDTEGAGDTGGSGGDAAPPCDHHVCTGRRPDGAGEQNSDQAPPPHHHHPLPTIVLKPPTYEETVAGQGGERPPRYSEACGEGLPDADSSTTAENTPQKVTHPTRQVRFDTSTTTANNSFGGSTNTSLTSHTTTTTTTTTRRRHFSAQERRILEELLAAASNDDPLRQRCFSFNALRDAFRSDHRGGRRHSSSAGGNSCSSSNPNTERQILLQQHTTTEVFTSNAQSLDDDVFLSVELLGPPPAGPLPDNVTVLNGPQDLDLAGLLSATHPQLRHRHASGPPTDRGDGRSTRSRQRHASAPDSSRKSAFSRSRNTSGH